MSGAGNARRILGKSLEALGIASVMVGLAEGVLGTSMWGELYLSVAGVIVFIAGRRLEKRP
ncbi:MAG TPA: hypothetical protein VL221_08100 [Bacteroidota bacterium]|nr:hypothetical protein [Bacteroidota bacterium]